MSGHEVMVQRLTVIISELYQYGFVSRQKLIDEFKISERTLYRDLNRLGDRLISDNNGIYKLSPAYAKHQSLKDLQNIVRILGIEELIPAKKLFAQSELTSLSIRSLPGDPKAKKMLESHYSLFDNAIIKNFICEFYYKDKFRTVEPYRLINLKSVWYMGAVENSKVKGYQIRNIHWVNVTSSHFKPESYIAQYFSEEDDVWFSLDKQTVKIMVSAEVRSYFLRRKVLPAQKLIRQEPNGELIFQTEMAHENQLFPLLRYWLPNLTIISPESLQLRFHQKLNQQLAEMETNFKTTFDNI